MTGDINFGDDSIPSLGLLASSKVTISTEYFAKKYLQLLNIESCKKVQLLNNIALRNKIALG
jgi:hypothetical protein